LARQFLLREDEMGRAYSTNGETRNAYRIIGEKVRRKETTRKT
jgi:hypothetical protein